MAIKKYLVNNPRGCNGRISLEVNEYTIFNKDEFLKFLIKFQGQVIDIEIPEGVCLTSLGLYDILDMFDFLACTIRTNNIVEPKPSPTSKLEHHPDSYQYFDVPPIIDYSEYQRWTGKKIFGALYNRPIWHRMGLTGHLLTHHADKVSLNFRHNPHDQDQRPFFEVAKLFEMHPNSLTNFMNIQDQLPIVLESLDGYTVGATTEKHTDQLASFYLDFLIDIVSETYTRGKSFYPTEKTIRPMLLKKPFIHMGSKCFLIHLRQMGFKTFNDFWDESYDGYGPNEKYLMILDLIDSISKKPLNELIKMYMGMKDILDHNYNLLKDKKFIKEVTYVDD